MPMVAGRSLHEGFNAARQIGAQLCLEGGRFPVVECRDRLVLIRNGTDWQNGRHVFSSPVANRDRPNLTHCF